MAKPQILQVTATYIDVATVPKNARTRDALTVSARPVSHGTRAPAAVQAEAAMVSNEGAPAKAAQPVVPPLRLNRGRPAPATIETSPLRPEALVLAAKPDVPMMQLVRGSASSAPAVIERPPSSLRPDAIAVAAEADAAKPRPLTKRSSSFGRFKVEGDSGPSTSGFIAHVLCDFNPTMGQGPTSNDQVGALAVRKGDYVTVLEQHPAPDGWCYCQVSRESGAAHEEGLVPWFFLTAVDDPKHKALAMAFTSLPRSGLGAAAPPAGIPPEGLPELVRSCSLLISADPAAKRSAPPEFMPPDPPGTPRRSDAGSLPSESPRGARDEEGAWLDVTVNRSDDGKGALGLDVNEANRICRIAPSSAAAKDGDLKVGDIVHSVDGEAMVNKVLAHSIDHTKASYRLRVWRPPKVGPAAMSEPMPESSIMDTLRLEKVAQGIARPVGDPSITYICHKGRELDNAFRSPGGTAKHINIAHEMKH